LTYTSSYKVVSTYMSVFIIIYKYTH